jgi:transposase
VYDFCIPDFNKLGNRLMSYAVVSNSDSSNKWDHQTKFTVVLETAAMNEQERSTYCCEKGLYPTQIEDWREACLNGVDEAPISPKAARDEIRALKKDKKKS